jgi:hypothetical protein
MGGPLQDIGARMMVPSCRFVALLMALSFPPAVGADKVADLLCEAIGSHQERVAVRRQVLGIGML